jgi:hypothetical protein
MVADAGGWRQVLRFQLNKTKGRTPRGDASRIALCGVPTGSQSADVQI